MTRNEARNPKTGKPPASCRTESQSWKAPCIVRDGIPRLESSLHRAGRNPKAGKLPASCGTESQGWKAPCIVQDEIPRLESFLHCAGRNPKAGKLLHGVGAESRQLNVGAGFACPNVPTIHTLMYSGGQTPPLHDKNINPLKVKYK